MSFESPLPPYNASDPNATFLNSSCLDLLMIELVPMAYRIVNEVDDDSSAAPMVKEEGSLKSKGGISTGEGRSAGEVVNGSNKMDKMDEDEERDAVFFRLEMLGYRVGQGLVERYV
jgi:hypothetical protein